MDNQLAKSIISKFDRNAFEAFFQKLLTHPSYGRNIMQLSDIDDRIYDCLPERFNYSVDAFFMCYSPYTIYDKFSHSHVDFSELKDLVSKYISKRKYVGPWTPQYSITLYIINNFDSMRLGVSDKELMLRYEKELTSVLPSSLYDIGVGNINTFTNHTDEDPERLQNILRDFLTTNDEGICISLSDKRICASRFMVENEFCGATKKTMCPIQPAFKKMSTSNDILDEFNKLIFSDAQERTLEEFLRQYYKEVLGGKYDSISTQVWLKFPELDIGLKDRRLDIFMRNSVLGDWELFELKRSNIHLTKTVSDVPMFVSTVSDAIAQVKNYKRLLEQDKVKRALSAEGIEYYEPEVNLIIGKKPSISTPQWRRLIADNQNGIKIVTYDTLLAEARHRLAEVESIIR